MTTEIYWACTNKRSTVYFFSIEKSDTQKNQSIEYFGKNKSLLFFLSAMPCFDNRCSRWRWDKVSGKSLSIFDNLAVLIQGQFRDIHFQRKFQDFFPVLK